MQHALYAEEAACLASLPHLLQAASVFDQGYGNSEDGITLGSKANADTKQNTLVRRASKALLKQVEETRKKYAVEVEGLKGEIQLLTKQTQRDRREADLASVTAAAAKKAALNATEELERINAEVQRAKRALQQLNRRDMTAWPALMPQLHIRKQHFCPSWAKGSY